MAMIFTSISSVKTVVNTSSLSSMAAFPAPLVDALEPVDAHPRPSSFVGCIRHSTTAFEAMKARMNRSNCHESFTTMHALRSGFVRLKVPKHDVSAYW